MIKKIILLIIFFVFQIGCKNAENDKINTQKPSLETEKSSLIKSDKMLSFDIDIKLSEDELELNQKLVTLKDSFDKSIKINKPKFYTEPFHNVKNYIESTTLFEVIQSMPKGGLLHTHSAGITDVKWLIEKATTMANCYVYTQHNDENLYGQLGVFQEDKVPTGFELLKAKINSDSNFSSELYNLLILDRNSLGSSNDYWVEFEKRFMRIMPLLSYRPFFKAYYKKSFLDILKDNISHVEIRFIFGNLFDEKNDSYPIDIMVEDLMKLVTEVQKTHPKFTLNLIYTSFKFLGDKEINNRLNEAFRLKKKYPNLITGFDLVAEEDRGNTIDFYNDSWKKLDSLEKATNLNLPLFLHAGESNSIKNKNLYDAVLQGSERIGHGLNLVLYPNLIEEVKKKDILVEVNPLSNQILGYVSDLRNHPARILLNNGIQCSISNDDPGVYGYEGLSYDFFMAFVAWELDLKAVKKLVFNSIEYSTLAEIEKEKTLQSLQKDWNKFVFNTNTLLNSKNLN